MITMPALHNPWLIAAWPGMGRVAQTAGEYLAAMLDMQHVGDFPADRFFETTDVAIESGVIRPGPRPRCPVFLWKDPQQRHDLVLLLGEAQPQLGGYQLCEQIVEQAKQWHISRVFTFAAMATQMQPGDAARVFGGVSTAPLLEQLTRYGVLPITGGQIGGMNGLMLAAAQQQNIEAVGLLGELPYFATQVPNPRASSVVLHVFARMLDLKLDLTELDEQAEKVDQQLMQLVQQLRRQAEQEEGFEEDEEASEFGLGEFSEEPPPGPEPPGPESKLDPEAERRIEELFQEAERDRSKAYQLKRELDRLDVFKAYEDRFLDLFKRSS